MQDAPGGRAHLHRYRHNEQSATAATMYRKLLLCDSWLCPLPINRRIDAPRRSSVGAPCAFGVTVGLLKSVVSAGKEVSKACESRLGTTYLSTLGCRLPHGHVYCIAVHHALCYVANVGDKSVYHVQRKRFTDDNSKNLRLLLIGRQRIAYAVS